jgi:hypothetical protein
LIEIRAVILADFQADTLRIGGIENLDIAAVESVGDVKAHGIVSGSSRKGDWLVRGIAHNARPRYGAAACAGSPRGWRPA